ncbi:hypothetical protein FJ364_00295, partial [Candidatus Dependentiae bacterium]|nr:hypothetical protein [Candidatus Dependentiae bacterium]
MRLRVIMIVLCLFLSPYLQGFNEEVLKEIAEAQGYGYKYANLNELRKLTASFNEENKKPIDEGNMLAVQVPDFIGISSARVIDALVQVDVDVAAGWAQVIEGYSFERALEEKRIPSDFWLQQEVFV